MSARRPYTTRVHCQHSGCRETAFYESDTRRDERETRDRYVGKWKCSRHAAPNKVLGPDSTPRVVEITALARPEVDISGMVIHHRCRVKHCVNPAHLEPLTKSEHGTRHYREANP